MIILETKGISVKNENVVHHFQNSISMVVADNLAAHALGSYFYNFSTVSKFCRFCNFIRNQMLKDFNSNESLLRTKVAYDSNIAQLGGTLPLLQLMLSKSVLPCMS